MILSQSSQRHRETETFLSMDLIWVTLITHFFGRFVSPQVLENIAVFSRVCEGLNMVS